MDRLQTCLCRAHIFWGISAYKLLFQEGTLGGLRGTKMVEYGVMRLWLDFPFLFQTGPSQRGRRVSDLYSTSLSSSANILSSNLSSLLPHSTTTTTTQPDTLTKISYPSYPTHLQHRDRIPRASVMTNMSTMSHTPRHSRTTSPPLSVATPSTVGPQTQRLNVVTRLTVEGNAKRSESVPIKMYMKVCRPPSITPTRLTYPLL